MVLFLLIYAVQGKIYAVQGSNVYFEVESGIVGVANLFSIYADFNG